MSVRCIFRYRPTNRAGSSRAIWPASTACTPAPVAHASISWKFFPERNFASVARCCAIAASITRWLRPRWIALGDTRWATPYVGAVALVFVFAVLCLDGFLSSVERVKFADVVSDPLVTIVSLLGWAGLWALASRIVVSRFHFTQHVTIAVRCGPRLYPLERRLGLVRIYSAVDTSQLVCGFVRLGIDSCGAGLWPSRFRVHMRRRSRLRAALLVSLTVLGISAISDYAARSKFSTVMEYIGVVKPLDAAVVPAVSIDQFFAGSEKLKTELTAWRKRPRPTNREQSVGKSRRSDLTWRHLR